MALTLAEAREQVKTNCSATTDPTLSDPEVEALLVATVRGSAWVTDTAYTVGQVVIPTTRNGHAYRVLQAGTSGATEPGWSLLPGGVVSDGSTLLYAEIGPDWGELYDLRRATYQAFRLKLSKASTYLTVGGDGQTVNLQQIVQNLEGNARRWAPLEIGG